MLALVVGCEPWRLLLRELMRELLAGERLAWELLAGERLAGERLAGERLARVGLLWRGGRHDSSCKLNPHFYTVLNSSLFLHLC